MIHLPDAGPLGERGARDRDASVATTLVAIPTIVSKMIDSAAVSRITPGLTAA